MRFCKSCILPSTRPNLIIEDDGICNACKSNSISKKSDINWSLRKSEFIDLFTTRGDQWDCLIPVSGGKDSLWAVGKALELGLRPLCITWKTASRNILGRKNLDNLINMGVDHIDFTVNPKVERYFTKKCFLKTGIPLTPMHLAIYNLPIRIARDFRIPIILYGENSAVEYGGSSKFHGSDLSPDWIRRFGVNAGTIAEDWIDDQLSYQDLTPYRQPKLSQFVPRPVFLSYFFEWNVFITKQYAIERGLEVPSNAMSGKHAFSDIDEAFMVTIHHWLKWYKFGFTRRWDNLSLDIRAGLITRRQAIEELINSPENIPIEQIKLFSNYIDISVDQFWSICKSFRGSDSWYKDHDVWRLKNKIDSKFDELVYMQ